MKNAAIALLALCFGAASCSKTELPPRVEGEPIFHVVYQTEAQNEAGRVEAGKEGKYLFTRFWHEPAAEVLTFSGAFADATCLDEECPGALRFEFRNAEKGMALDTAIFRGAWSLRNIKPSEDTVYRLSLSAYNSMGQAAEYVWKVAQLIDLQGQNVEQIFDEPTTVKVALNALYTATNIKGHYTTTVSVASSPEVCPSASIRALPDPANGGTILGAKTDAPAAEFLWNTGSHEQSFFVDGALGNEYVVTVTMPNGCSAVAALSHLPNVLESQIESPSFEREISTEQVPGDALQLHTAAIQWIDNEGVVWRSDRQAQPSGDAIFAVSEVENYAANEHGEATVKMKIVFSCLLFSPSGEAQRIVGEGIIAVARP